MAEKIGLLMHVKSGPGVMHEWSGAMARSRADITSVDILSIADHGTRLYVEAEIEGAPDSLIADLRSLDVVLDVTQEPSMSKIYGKRIIIIGGGAQVGQVAIGAVSEADRHNIRGEHISVDTMPLVGEAPLAQAVRAVARLPRAKVLVLAGAIMGGDIEKAVREVREQGLIVISLNMVGSVPEAADLVVTDPVQAGVMAVMLVADTATFRLERLKQRRVF
jgi:energy-converting hydrogenase B subunit Q